MWLVRGTDISMFLDSIGWKTKSLLLKLYSPETQELSKKTTQESGPTEDKEAGQTPPKSGPGHITFAPQTHPAPSSNRALRVPGPRDFERGELPIGYQRDDVNSPFRL